MYQNVCLATRLCFERNDSMKDMCQKTEQPMTFHPGMVKNEQG